MPTLKGLKPCVLTLKTFYIDFSFHQHKIDWLGKIIALILENSTWKGLGFLLAGIPLKSPFLSREHSH